MPIPSPFHSRTSALCESQDWREWSGYYAVSKYNATHEYEYYSVRNSAGLLDVSPLHKYEISGLDAGRLVDRIMTRDIKKCAIHQVMYSPWCDEDGKVIDDGTISRLEENLFRVTAADRSLRWFEDCGYGLKVNVSDVSQDLAAVALQGPKSLSILNCIIPNAELNTLKYYWLIETRILDFPVTITRTGYTGDLGYEIWVSPDNAERLWDILIEKGADFGIAPIGLIALDMLRIEAGLLLLEVDYKSTFHTTIEEQKSSPFEIGLGWAVKLKGDHFIGKDALLHEKTNKSKWKFVGLNIQWESLEEKYGKLNLPPQLPSQASRAPTPIYKYGRQIGQATSLTFSPVLKKYIAIGTVDRRFGDLGSSVDLEITVEYSRETANATIVKPQFYNPKRKRAVLSE